MLNGEKWRGASYKKVKTLEIDQVLRGVVSVKNIAFSSTEVRTSSLAVSKNRSLSANEAGVVKPMKTASEVPPFIAFEL